MTTTNLSIRGLGPLHVSRDNTTLNVGGLKQRIVLGLLILSPNRVISRERLIGALWEDTEPTNAVRTLHVYMARLRRVLDSSMKDGVDGQLIRSESPGYILSVGSDVLDLLAFETLTQRAQETSDPSTTRALLAEALALWRGELLQDLQGHHFLLGESARWDELRGSAQRELMRAELSLGNHEKVVPELERLMGANPYDEDLAALQMIALYRSGRQAESLETFQRIRIRLTEDLGVEPGSAIRDLELQILNQEAELSLHRSAPAASVGATIRAPDSDRAMPTASIDTAGTTIPLTGSITTLGRRPDRDIVIEDEQASRRHAEIRRSTAGFTIVDLGSTNGTTINGERIETHLLKHEDIVQVGDAEFLFRLEHPE